MNKKYNITDALVERYLIEDNIYYLQEQEKAKNPILQLAALTLNKIEKYRKELNDLRQKLRNLEKATPGADTDKAKEDLKKLIDQYKQKIKDSWAVYTKQRKEAFAKMAKHKGKIAAGTAVIAAATAASVYAYKNYLSAAARACKDKKGKEKADCMRKFKVEGLKAKLGVLRSALKKCDMADDPVTCKEKFNDKIKAVEIQIDKLSKETK